MDGQMNGIMNIGRIIVDIDELTNDHVNMLTNRWPDVCTDEWAKESWKHRSKNVRMYDLADGCKYIWMGVWMNEWGNEDYMNKRTYR